MNVEAVIHKGQAYDTAQMIDLKDRCVTTVTERWD